MAQSLIWSEQALSDIESIAEYISRDSRYFAQQVVDNILELGEKILEQPKSGRIVPELNNLNIRERFIYSYRIIYELESPNVCVLAVIHGKRLLESIEQFNK